MYYLLFRAFPKSGFSRLMGWLASRQWPAPMLRAVIRRYIAIYGIDMSSFAEPEEGFPTFNAFFTRPLSPGARPADPDPGRVVSPVDGTVSQAGTIEAGRIFQAKGLDYSLEELLGGDAGWRGYDGGAFLTIYLSPRDYHRIHSPVAGAVTRFCYVPGELWTVGPAGVRGVPRLFARNERIVSFIETDFGEAAVVKVGATVVGKIRVVYDPVTSNGRRARSRAEVLPQPYLLERGAELGRFELGSTVICLFRPGEVAPERFQPGDSLLMGQAIGTVNGG